MRPITGRWADYGWDAREYLVKRHSVPRAKQHLIFVVENVVPLHDDCHVQLGQTATVREKCLDYAIADLGATTLSAERIATWYHRTQPEIGLPCGSIHLFERGEYVNYLKSLLS